MNVVVLLKTHSSSCDFQQLLSGVGVSLCTVVTTIEVAVRASQQVRACGIFFDRDLIIDYKAFFDQFPDQKLWFIPINKVRDNMDIINALNTHRTAYYLLYPITKGKVQIALECLAWRICNASQRIADKA